MTVRHPVRTGFTLMELTLSTAIMAILLIAIAGTVMVASTALPSAETEARTSTLDTAYSVDQIAAELQEAKTITAANATNITFTVADRDKDATDETIIYSWSGTAGDPLTRKYNARAAVTVIDNVQQFDLDYVYRIVAGEGEPVVVDGTEQLLLKQDASNMSLTGGYQITSSYSVAQEIAPPTMTADESWQVTKAMLMLDPSGGTNGSSCVVELAEAAPGTGEPGAVLDSVVVPESVLMSGFWHEVNFTYTGQLSKTSSTFIVVRHNAGSGNVARFKTGQGSAASPTVNMWYFWNNWMDRTNEDTMIWLYGKINSRTVPPPVKKCDSIGILLNTSTSDASAVQTRARTLNEPTLP